MPKQIRIAVTLVFLSVLPVVLLFKQGSELFTDAGWLLTLIVFSVISLIPASIIYISLGKSVKVFLGVSLALILGSSMAYHELLFIRWHLQGADWGLVLVPIAQLLSLALVSVALYLKGLFGGNA